MKLLSIKKLNVSFAQGGGVAHAVKDVSIDVHKGETVAIVGESGSGKSVSALSTVGLLAENATAQGSITYKGEEFLGASEQRLQAMRGNEISLIFQEPMTSLNPLHTLEKQISESLQVHQGLSKTDARPKVIELLNKVGISDPETRLSSYPHQLSGGQRQRVMIAMALANGPDLLIADEPTTALDVTIEAQILDLLNDLKRSEDMSLLFITHDLGVVRRIADRVYVMEKGEVVEDGLTAIVFETPKHPYTQKLLAAETVGQVPAVKDSAPVIASADHLKVWFPIQKGLLRRTVGHVKAVNDASFDLRAGETLGIVGESGSGKSTLALAMMRLIDSENQISFMDQRIDGFGRTQMRPLRKDMQIVFQDPYGSLSPRMSVVEIISEGLMIHERLSEQERRAKVAAMMDEVGLEPASMDRYPHEFSGGQRQRIAIARAMILQPKLVILDEPTSALDRTVQVQIVDLLRDLQQRYGLAYIFISHDLKVVRAMSHRVMVMKSGDIVEVGEAQRIFDAPQHPYTQTLLAAAQA